MSRHVQNIEATEGWAFKVEVPVVLSMGIGDSKAAECTLNMHYKSKRGGENRHPDNSKWLYYVPPMKQSIEIP